MTGAANSAAATSCVVVAARLSASALIRRTPTPLPAAATDAARTRRSPPRLAPWPVSARPTSADPAKPMAMAPRVSAETRSPSRTRARRTPKRLCDAIRSAPSAAPVRERPKSKRPKLRPGSSTPRPANTGQLRGRNGRPRAASRHPMAIAEEKSSTPRRSSGASSRSATFVRTVAAAHDVAATTVSESGTARVIGRLRRPLGPVDDAPAGDPALRRASRGTRAGARPGRGSRRLQRASSR